MGCHSDNMLAAAMNDFQFRRTAGFSSTQSDSQKTDTERRSESQKHL